MTNNQRFVAELLVLLIVGAAVLSKAAPQKPDDVLRARRFEVIGKDGKARIELAVDEEDRPHVRLLDTQGKERAALQLYRDGSPELSLTDPANGATVLLNVEDRAAGLSIYGSHSDTPEGITNRVIGLRVYKGQQAGLHIADSLTSHSGHVATSRALLNEEVEENGNAELILSGKKQPGRTTAHVSLSGQAGIAIYDKRNKRIWTAPAK